MTQFGAPRMWGYRDKITCDNQSPKAAVFIARQGLCCVDKGPGDLHFTSKYIQYAYGVLAYYTALMGRDVLIEGFSTETEVETEASKRKYHTTKSPASSTPEESFVSSIASPPHIRTKRSAQPQQ
ncbi:uncharacterized protein TrAFT101_000499 [Trichoderma asperellum]|uniref:uncharacterized protein n=1 Tax=Trichoderma asperellum TaxID=101201 RepID=UPI00331DE706|nr:hypothetical protein TrAFT101_000499 [Trichoderma asperellum]